jgi:hypothetical protein
MPVELCSENTISSSSIPASCEESTPQTNLPNPKTTIHAQVPNSNIWQTVLISLPPALKILLSQHGSFVGFQGNTANIQIKSTALKQKVDSHLAALESAFSQVTSQSIKVEGST